jgi:uncharacterized membrane protein
MFSVLSKNFFLEKYYFSRPEMEKLLIISALFSILLLSARVIITNKLLFVFLPWNLFLAWVPYQISTALMQKPGLVERRWKLGALCIAWILFIPNAFYILTDLFHLQLREESTRWFDLTLIFSFAWNGLLLGILSVRQMEKIASHVVGLKSEWLFLAPVMWLIALGIYIGRFMRFNSWDVITNPFTLFGEIGFMLIHPFRHFVSWSTIACFAIFMTIIYISIKRLAREI